jgi:hypothetical protein
MEAVTAQHPEEISIQPRKIPEIKPQGASVHYSGYAYKVVIFTMPEGLTLQDLHEHPECWRLVQLDRSGFALAEWDAVELRGRDAMITARVNWADSGKVVLFDIHRISKPARELPLFKDEHYEVRWAPEGGFSYWRTKDNCRMHNGTWATPDACKNELLRRQYPVTIG